MKMLVFRLLRWLTHRESGITFMETVIALAILGAVSVSFLNGLTTASKAVFITDEHSTAESIARTQMEWVKQAAYSYNVTAYSPAPMPAGKDYMNYSALITAEPLHATDIGIQKVTVSVKRFDEQITQITGYKVDR